ncbi:MAG: YfhO family protein [Thermoanaerobaculia bacterium]|nr:YfhO family protein [Thermoanaerobaculia bacterium]
MSVAGALAPGLCWLLAVGLLLALLARWGETVPRRIVALGLALGFLLLGPVLVGGRVLLPLDLLRESAPFQDLPAAARPANPLQRDLVTQMAPAQAAVRAALRRGEWPLWNAAVGAGESLLGRPAAQVLSPLQVAAGPLPLGRALGVEAALELFLAFLFTYLFLRRLGLGNIAAAFGAVAFGLSSYVVSWLGWPAATAAVWLPVLLLAIDRAVVSAPRRRDLALLGGAVFGVLTAGDDDAGRAVLAVAAAFALLRLAGLPPVARPGGLGRLVVAGLVGFTLAAPVVLARGAYTADSTVQSRVAAFVAERDRHDPLGLWSFDSAEKRAAWVFETGRRLLPSFVPDALGNDRAGAYWGAANVNEDGGGFAGTAALLLALVGACLPGRGLRFREARFFAGVLAVGVLLVARPPVLVEIADAFLSPSLHRHGLVVVAFAVATLGALAVERLQREGRGRLGRVVPVVVLLGVAFVAAHRAYPPPTPGNLEALRARTLGLQLVTLGAVVAILVVARKRPALLGALPLVAAAELLALGLPVHRPGLPEQFFPTPPALGFLAEKLGPGERLMALGTSFPPELAAIYGLADLRVAGFDHPAFYTRLIAPLTPPRQGRFDFMRRPDHPLLDLLGVRYVLAPPGTEAPAGLVRAFTSPTADVFERPQALPRVFLPATAERWDVAAGPWDLWTAANKDFRARSLVRETFDGAATWRAARPLRATADLREVTATHLRARVETGEPRLVATSIFGDPGWRALVNREVVATTVSNGPLLALWVPAGRHDVELVYRPRALVAGLALLACGLTLAAALLCAPRRGES